MESLRPTARMRLHFALAKAHDDLGDFGLAFHHMREANALKRAQIAYDEAASLELFDRIRETFDATLIAAKSGGGDPRRLTYLHSRHAALRAPRSSSRSSRAIRSSMARASFLISARSSAAFAREATRRSPFRKSRK